MHNLAQKIAEKMLNSSSYRGELEVVAYGLEVVLNLLTQVAIFIIFAIVLNILPQMMAVVVTALVFRVLSGGAHSATFACCTLISLIVFVFISYISINFSQYVLIPGVFTGIYVVIMAFTIMWSPVIDQKNISVNRQKKFKLYSSAFILFVFLLVIVSPWHDSLRAAATLALAWQAFTITPAGSRVIGKIDYLFQSGPTRST